MIEEILIIIFYLDILALIYIFYLLLTVNWRVHIQMVKDNTDNYGWGNYNSFVREFRKQNWTFNKIWNESLFDRDNNSEIHANIFKFNGKGMILPFFDYMKATKFVKEYIKENFISNSKETVNWNVHE